MKLEENSPAGEKITLKVLMRTWSLFHFLGHMFQITPVIMTKSTSNEPLQEDENSIYVICNSSL